MDNTYGCYAYITGTLFNDYKHIILYNMPLFFVQHT